MRLLRKRNRTLQDGAWSDPKTGQVFLPCVLEEISEAMNEPNEETRKRLADLIKVHVAQLCEHFQNVQILCSNAEEGGDGTATFVSGSGNWCARIGHAREWIMYHDEMLKCKARGDAEEI